MIFDQFEELYSKPELFGIFKAAKDLMLDVAGSKRNFVLGFAWKTDSTTQQDHPAYHMWHELADHRREYKLDVFDNGEISQSITQFEKEIGQKITAQSRHQIAHSSQGFPWLLKKLCINLYEGVSKGEGSESILVDLDAERLFESDLETLSQSEISCLKLVAEKAPADWSEIIEISGTDPLNSLIHKRLVIKSGDRLNVYWDIFKDYLLTGRVPAIPFNYIPTTDLTSMLNVCEKLEGNEFIDAIKLANSMSLNEKTVWNIGADLVMFGLAEREGTSFKLHRDMSVYSDKKALELLRSKLDKHSLKIALYKKMAGKLITNEQIKKTLILCLPKEKFGEKTWSTYTNRLRKFLICAGFLSPSGNNAIVQDSGTPIQNRLGLARTGRQGGQVFSHSVSPNAVIAILENIQNGETDPNNLSRNALAVLKRFGLITVEANTIILNKTILDEYNGSLEAIWSSAKNEISLIRCVDLLNQNPSITNKELARQINDEFKLDWSDGSIKRNGGILKQWSGWLKEGIDNSCIPHPPGRTSDDIQPSDTPELLGLIETQSGE